MFKHRSQPSTTGKSKMSKKLIGGFAALAATAIITAGGFAAAAPADKPPKEFCQKYSNYGQCVREWAKTRGHGYGGNNTNININLSNLHNTIVQIIINLGF